MLQRVHRMLETLLTCVRMKLTAETTPTASILTLQIVRTEKKSQSNITVFLFAFCFMFVHLAGHLEKCEGAIPYFRAKIAPNSIIVTHLVKIHYFPLLCQNCTFSHFLPKIALL